MAGVSLVLRCSGCATLVDPSDPGVTAPFRCPNATRAPDIDHVLTWDPISAGVTTWPSSTALNPYVRYRTLQHAYWLHRAGGATDDDHVALVERLDRAVVDVDGVGFVSTPLIELDRATAQTFGVDEVWAKVEAGNVGGSHKSRHLMGVLLHLEARRMSARIPLAIASCGNAAIAAAVLARASRRSLQVFVPAWASAAVRDRLHALGATITDCPRRDDDPAGDPCLHRFHESVEHGSLPFCVQGNENGFTIDGGATLGHELADQFAMLGSVPDRLVIQAGGGALGSSIVRGLRDAVELGVITAMPAIHIAQAEGCAPLVRAWRLTAERAVRSTVVVQHGDVAAAGPSIEEPLTAIAALTDQQLAARCRETAMSTAIDEALRYAATHRSQFMWPWDEEPSSVATGLLDDETYDWHALLSAMFTTGGWPVVVTDRQIERGVELACPHPLTAEGVPADATGAAGLAGALALSHSGHLAPTERIAVIITSARS